MPEELVFLYNEFFDYEEFAECLGPVMHEFMMMPEGQTLYSTRGDLKKLSDAELTFEARQMFDKLGIKNLDGMSGFIYHSADYVEMHCEALYMEDGVLKRDAFDIPLDATIIIEPEAKTGEETAIF